MSSARFRGFTGTGRLRPPRPPVQIEADFLRAGRERAECHGLATRHAVGQLHQGDVRSGHRPNHRGGNRPEGLFGTHPTRAPDTRREQMGGGQHQPTADPVTRPVGRPDDLDRPLGLEPATDHDESPLFRYHVPSGQNGAAVLRTGLSGMVTVWVIVEVAACLPPNSTTQNLIPPPTPVVRSTST